MGTYVHGLSGDFKIASLNGQKVRVCAYRFLYKESFDGPSQRLRKKTQRAEERHERLNPAYAATVHEQEWDGVIVYEGPKLGTWADVRPLPSRGGPIGFLVKIGKRWEIRPRCILTEEEQFGKIKIPRQVQQRIDDGKLQVRVLRQLAGHWVDGAKYEKWKVAVLALKDPDQAAQRIAEE